MVPIIWQEVLPFRNQDKCGNNVNGTLDHNEYDEYFRVISENFLVSILDKHYIQIRIIKTLLIRWSESHLD